MEGLRSKRPQRVNELLRMNERGRRTLVSPGTADPGSHEVAAGGPLCNFLFDIRGVYG